MGKQEFSEAKGRVITARERFRVAKRELAAAVRAYGAISGVRRRDLSRSLRGKDLGRGQSKEGLSGVSRRDRSRKHRGRNQSRGQK